MNILSRSVIPGASVTAVVLRLGLSKRGDANTLKGLNSRQKEVLWVHRNGSYQTERDVQLLYC